MRTLIILLVAAVSPTAWSQAVGELPEIVSNPRKGELDEAALEETVQSGLAALLQKQAPKPDLQDPPAIENRDGTSTDTPPPEFGRSQDVPLTRTAEAAIDVSERWQTHTATPAPGPDGRVLYTYGAGLATIVCAPLRICTVELQAGERLVAEPHIGDAVRWNIAPALYGEGASSTTVIVIKPQEAGLDTSLLIPTDRRIYYVRLISKLEDYTARVAFAYPDDALAQQRWQEHVARREEERREASRIAELAPSGVERMNFNYQIRGDGEIRPIMVFDDGEKTFIRMDPEIEHRELPILIVIGPDGDGEMLNYRVKEEFYIADRLFDDAQLLLGEDGKGFKVEIRRDDRH